MFSDYVGLEVVERTDLTICQDPSEPEIPYKLKVCEIYAVFDNSADRLISTAFSNVSTTDPAGFYQHTLGGNTAPACGLIAIEPTAECDSFVTLGVDCFALDDNSSTDPDFDGTAFNSSGTVSGGWFNSAPPNGQGDPDANGRVMIARFSYKQNKNTSGTLSVFAKLAGSDVVIEYPLQAFDCSTASSGGGGAPEPQSAGAPLGGTICYVDDDGASGNTCLNGWTDACRDLQTALAQASMGLCNQIWVAQGVYLPSDCEPSCTETDRLDSFELLPGVALYG
ncbi:MAG: hypothetical protein IIB58_11280, partial [Planctomycetes bacterium]|nr:hypothetical protein [Planctomycetota bacterium]